MKTTVPEKTKAPEKTIVSSDSSSMGEVKIHENVIATLVRKATMLQEGVSRLAGSSFVDGIAEAVGIRRIQDRSIIVTTGDDNRVSVEVKILIMPGYKLPVVTTRVQKAVIEEVENITGMTVTAVNVTVQDIDTPSEAAPEPENAE